MARLFPEAMRASSDGTSSGNSFMSSILDFGFNRSLAGQTFSNVRRITNWMDVLRKTKQNKKDIFILDLVMGMREWKQQQIIRFGNVEKMVILNFNVIC